MFKYKAFISYSHQDESWANWLHDQLEGYQPPESLNVSGRLAPIFQDHEELAASRDLSKAIENALRSSECLIVICSPAAAASQWVRAEIERYIAIGRDEHIFCLIVDGIPNDPVEECLPEPLRTREPLAADVRGTGHARSNSVLRLIAGMLGVRFDDLRRRDSSIAVLPFRDLSPFGDKEYLSDGFAEELLNRLTRLRDLRVISRTSSFRFKGSGQSAAEIGQLLDATYVVEGSIRTMGNALRVTVQLIDSRTDATRWSMVYDRMLDELFALQDEIAADMADELHHTIRAQARARRSVNGDAYQLLLRARHLSRQFTKEALQRSNELLLQAIKLEPEYLDAWNALSSNYCSQAGEGFAPQSALEDSRAAVERVLAIEPNEPEALSTLGWLALRFDNDLPAAASVLQRALASGASNAGVLNSVAGLLTRIRRINEAIVIVKQMAALDPLNSHAFANLGVYNLLAGRYDEAIDAYRTALEVSPGFTGAYFAIGLALLQKGEPESALASMERESDEEFRTKGKAFAYFDLGDTTAFQAELDKLISTWGEYWPSEVSEAYAYAGMADEAFDWMLRDADDAQGAGWAESVLNPVYAKLHDDPRWHAFLTKCRLAPEQLARIPFELPENLLPYG